MSDHGDPAYDNTHRAFLQSLLARQTITFAEAKPILAAIQTVQTPNRPTLPEDVSQADFEYYVDALNTHISAYDFEIRSTHHQVSKERIYALVNTTSDALTQMATVHTPDEIAFVKRVLDAMFETYNTQVAEVMAVTSMQALKCARPPHGEQQRRDSGNQTQVTASSAALTGSQAQSVLESIVQEGWFELSAKGYHSLSPRALMELRGWLVETYNDQGGEDSDEEEDDEHVKIKFCAACREIVTVGQRCTDLGCGARVHNHCTRNLWRSQGGKEECPTCKKAWTEAPAVGEKAARQGARQATNGPNGPNGRRRRSPSDEAQSGAEED
ncbi:hypothetical protein LTR35_016432 [Friedmanniomyces endolithicus]|uniref:Non-structural maintenance of chromosomes element 1 homolog n=1 Tax=Friedmanniomyces endolithicus TaxID=329885 RepID=A0AAN6F8D3_9PEZI|nr:hypothetical protein LTR35_016432 [Friedmanniomyces endolithicus]KAK0273136.1 hypothetical protein LTS00_015964 [Friedmanniomyces endolithicus]KAK0305900.1 hypothetical protein LTR82_016621 [Friedmanniomyces endolithicus]KAK0977299.1 hypothetical protein LTR54_016250 [Friedmanniomyces endolithicus]